MLFVIFQILFDQRLQFLQHLTDELIFLVQKQWMARLYGIVDRHYMFGVVKLIILHTTFFTNLADLFDSTLKPCLIRFLVFMFVCRGNSLRLAVINRQRIFRDGVTVHLIQGSHSKQGCAAISVTDGGIYIFQLDFAERQTANVDILLLSGI